MVSRLLPTSWAMLATVLIAVAPAAALAEDAVEHAPAHGMTAATPASDKTPLFDNLGTWHRAITTRSADAQKYFDQGLRQLYGFDMQGAEASFRKATALYPTSAACWWGVAMSLGPHVNIPALPDRTHAAYEAEQKAQALASSASEVERALIEALARRYRDPQPADPKEELAAETDYAKMMRAVHQKFPDDPDVASMYAESMMDLRPWDYWTAEGTPHPGTEEIVSTLEQILAQHPDHPGANHLYIHAVEASPHPEKAVASADRLRNMMPGLGHMVHMPSHTYQRVGRYADAELANRKAIQSDDAYRSYADPQGFFVMYAAHNVGFLAYTLMTQGRSAEALERARHAGGMIPLEMFKAMPGFDIFLAQTDFMMVQFRRWDDILQAAPPAEGFPFLAGVRHWARGMAFAGKNQVDQARIEADSLTAIAERIPADAIEDLNSAQALLAIGTSLLRARLDEKHGDLKAAIAKYEEAVKGEDATRYSEPPDWPVHTRWYLGVALQRAGRAADAERVYREDLRRHPGNGWALNGLATSLRAQKKTAEAARVNAEFKKAWPKADVKLTAMAGS